MHHLDLFVPEGSQNHFTPPWTPPLPGHSFPPLQLPPIRNPLAFFPTSHWDPHQYSSGHPDLPSSIPRTQHNARLNWTYDPSPYQHSLLRLNGIYYPTKRSAPGGNSALSHPLTTSPITSNQLLRGKTSAREPAKTTKRGRRRSSTVSAIPFRVRNSKTSDSPVQAIADDKPIMLRYYTDKTEPKKKRMRKASSSGALGNYIALASEPDKPELIAQLPKRDLPMLKGFQYLKLIGEHIRHSTGLREPVSVCADDNAERETPDDVSNSDYDSDGPPPLVIDLPEEEEEEYQTSTDEQLHPTNSITTSKTDPVCEDQDQEILPDILPIDDLLAAKRQTDSPPSYFSSVQRALLPVVPFAPVTLSTTRTSTAPADQATTTNSLSTQTVPSITKGGKFQCKRCHNCFSSIGLLVRHRSSCLTQRDPPQRVTCTQCHKTFNSSKACSDHWKEYHSIERPHQCHKCGRRFTLARALEKHNWIHQ